MKRKRLHLASVFACNFVNALYGIANDILTQDTIPFEVLKPLIGQTARKIQEHSPETCQTGPAVREDLKVINEHLESLKENPELQLVYKVISDRIMNKRKK